MRCGSLPLPIGGIDSVLRDFVRSVIFERFALSAGVATGLAQAALVAWAMALGAGPGALAPALLVGLAAALVAANAWAVPLAGARRAPGRASRAVADAYLALAFSTIALAAALTAFAAVFAGAAALLAFAGVPGEAGFALFRGASAALAAAVGGSLAWGFAVAPRRLEVTLVQVMLPGLAPAQHGLRIAHLSDLHVGNGAEGARLARIVASANALAPDLIVLTGDLFDHDPAALVEGARALDALRARLGVFAVLGNHDHMTGAELVAAALSEHAPALELLRGRFARLPLREPLYVAGLDDPGHDWTARGGRLPALDALAAAAPADGPAILLVHRPDAFPQAAALGFGLVLAGHFHGGQLALPGGGGRWNAARLLTRFHRGVYRLGASTLYVSRGLGFAGPRIRLGSPPEIALVELAAPGDAA